MDKLALGRKGEIFVMQNLMERGWKFPENYSETINGSDLVFEKNNRKIKIRIKTTLSKNIRFNVSDITFNYLIVTNLRECWILPMELIETTNNCLTKTFRQLVDNYALLDISGRDLLSQLIDCRIKPRFFITTSHIFFPLKPLSVDMKYDPSAKSLIKMSEIGGI